MPALPPLRVSRGATRASRARPRGRSHSCSCCHFCNIRNICNSCKHQPHQQQRGATRALRARPRFPPTQRLPRKRGRARATRGPKARARRNPAGLARDRGRPIRPALRLGILERTRQADARTPLQNTTRIIIQTALRCDLLAGPAGAWVRGSGARGRVSESSRETCPPAWRRAPRAPRAPSRRRRPSPFPARGAHAAPHAASAARAQGPTGGPLAQRTLRTLAAPQPCPAQPAAPLRRAAPTSSRMQHIADVLQLLQKLLRQRGCARNGRTAPCARRSVSRRRRAARSAGIFYNTNIPPNFLTLGYVDIELECPSETTAVDYITSNPLSNLCIYLVIVYEDPQITTDTILAPPIDMKHYNVNMPIRLY
jgi:hypothetical protein